MKVKIKDLSNFSPDEKDKLTKACTLLEQVLNSDEFRNRVWNYSRSVTTGSLWWKKTTTENTFSENKGFTNVQVYTRILSGATTLDPIEDMEMDVDAVMYSDLNSKVIGYTYLSAAQTWMNRKFFDTMSAAEIAGNIAHEYCHQLGFGHNYKPWGGTVPYAIGNLVVELAGKL